MLNYELSDLLKGGNVTRHNVSDPVGSVYFLIKNGVVVYVGQSVSLKCRIKAHRGNKDFDTFSFINVYDHSLNDIEAFYIAKFDPELNIRVPKNSIIKSANNIVSHSAKKIKAALLEISDFDMRRKDIKENQWEVSFLSSEKEAEIMRLVDNLTNEIKKKYKQKC